MGISIQTIIIALVNFADELAVKILSSNGWF